MSETRIRARYCRPLDVYLSDGTNTSVLWVCLNYQHTSFHPSCPVKRSIGWGSTIFHAWHSKYRTGSAHVLSSYDESIYCGTRNGFNFINVWCYVQSGRFFFVFFTQHHNQIGGLINGFTLFSYSTFLAMMHVELCEPEPYKTHQALLQKRRICGSRGPLTLPAVLSHTELH